MSTTIRETIQADQAKPSANASGGTSQGRFERIARVDRPSPGDYWRALKTVEFHEPSRFREGKVEWVYTAKEGEVLMIADVRLNAGVQHTVMLQEHPSKGKDTIWILIDEFLLSFEHAPDGADVRAAELADLQRKIDQIQHEITRAASDPDYLNAQIHEALALDEDDDRAFYSSLPARPGDLPPVDVLNAQAPSINQALRAGSSQLMNQALDVLRGAQQRATLQADWFQSRAKGITTIASQMAPYLMERAQVALARNKASVDRAKKLMESVSTMKLFGGDGVTCTKIVDGTPAPTGTPIKLFQRKLFLDEEMAYVSAYIGGLDVTNFHKVVDELARNATLRDLLIPAARGCVLVAVSRQQMNRGNDLASALQSLRIEEANQAGFLLVRDGDALYTVDSPVPSHEECTQLFPEQNIDGTVFTAPNGDSVTVEDLRWTVGLSALESLAVHYRRFAVILAGLIAKEQFWAGVDFQDLFSGAGNARTFELVHDASGDRTLGETLESVTSYFARLQRGVRVGQRVLVDLAAHACSLSVPKAYNSKEERVARPIDEFVDARVEEESGALYVHAQYERDNGNRASLRVYIVRDGAMLGSSTSWICVEGVDPKEVDRLLAHRANRAKYTGFMKILRRVRDVAEANRASSEPVIQRLADDLVAGCLAAPAQARAIAADAVASTLVALGGRITADALTEAQWEDLRALAFRLTDAGQIDPADVAVEAAAQELEPLRMFVEHTGRVLLYVRDPAPDNRLFEQKEVMRYIVQSGPKKIRLTPASVDVLWATDYSGRLLHEWPAAQAWVQTKAPVMTKRRKGDVIADVLGRFEREWPTMFGPLDDAAQGALVKRFAAEYRKANLTSRYIMTPDLTMPIGLLVSDRGPAKVLGLRMSSLGLQRVLSDAHRAEFRRVYIDRFRVASNAVANLDGALAWQPDDVELVSCSATDWVVGRDLFSPGAIWSRALVDVLELKKILPDAEFGSASGNEVVVVSARSYWDQWSSDFNVAGTALSALASGRVTSLSMLLNGYSRSATAVLLPAHLQQYVDTPNLLEAALVRTGATCLAGAAS